MSLQIKRTLMNLMNEKIHHQDLNQKLLNVSHIRIRYSGYVFNLT
jgi:hypothetical protein